MSIKTKGAGMSSCKPYLLRAIHEWIVVNDMTPFILVDIAIDGVIVPVRYAQGNKIVLNISMMATQDLVVESDHIRFSARFSGIVEEIYVPIKAVMAIYTKENGRGMAFEPEDDEDAPPPPKRSTPPSSPKKPPSSGGGKPQLTVVK